MYNFLVGRDEEVVPVHTQQQARARAALVLNSAATDAAEDWSITFGDCRNN